MISLGRWRETMKPACMTLSHSPCHTATFISSSSLSLSVFLSTSLCLFLGEMHRFTFVCTVTHTYSTVTARNRVHWTAGADLEEEAYALLLPLPKMKLLGIRSHLVQSGRKCQKRLCSKVTGEMAKNRWEIASDCRLCRHNRKTIFLNQLSALSQSRAQGMHSALVLIEKHNYLPRSDSHCRVRLSPFHHKTR